MNQMHKMVIDSTVKGLNDIDFKEYRNYIEDLINSEGKRRFDV